MKRTAFFPIHQQLGAKMVEFGGYEMPVLYSGIMEEHKAVRKSVGIFDVSHMGEFEIRGRDALALVQKVTTNDAAMLVEGRAQYSAMCYSDGGIVDDLLVYNLGDRFMLVVNASNIPKDLEWIRSNAKGMEVEIDDRSSEYSLLAVQGPRSLSLLQQLTAHDLSSIPYYGFARTTLAGVEMIVSRTGYTGELGFELYFGSSTSMGGKVWNAVAEKGREFDLKPVGLGARDTLRLEMGFCLYGNDIDQTTNPLEAGLGWITKLGKETFVGKAVLENIKKEGLKRKLIGFVIDEERAFPRHEYPIHADGAAIGFVTSGTVSPILDKGVGMGYVAIGHEMPGSNISIMIRNKPVQARVVKTPFIEV